MPDLIIGGAGFFGLTIAEKAASQGYKVLVVEQRNKIGGNSASHKDSKTGIEVHTYGPHIFHTNNEIVWKYVNKFTSFIPYKHKVKTVIADGRVIPLPFGLATYSTYYNIQFTPALMDTYNGLLPANINNTFKETAISSIGEDLYREVVESYTKKHWGCDPDELPVSVIKRLPVRRTWEDGYFTDKYQGIPSNGYQTWLNKMANHPNITVLLNTNVLDFVPTNIPFVYTGALDAFFKYKFGHLGWRSIDLIESHPDTNDFQGCAQMNYADANIPYTRIHEYKHYRPDIETIGTVIHKEYPRNTEPYETGAYPINAIQDREKLQKYREATKELKGVWLGGRLGSYKYLDMDAVIASALTLWNNKIKPYLEAQCHTV